jgi:hypothetical protein
MGLFTKSPEQRAEQARAKLPKAEANRDGVRQRLAAAQDHYHRVNSGRGVGGMLASMSSRETQQQRRDHAAQGVDQLQSRLVITDQLVSRLRAEAGLPPEVPADGPHAVPNPAH